GSCVPVYGIVPGGTLRVPADEEAMNEIGPSGAGPRKLSAVLHALDDGADAQPASDLEELAGDEVLDRVAVHLADQLSVELDEIGPQPVHQRERRPARAEVVEGPPDTVAPVAGEH